ncbi:Alpha-(1,6)-fucosyltransferase, partial [Stegodyphus mimosarum]
LSKTDYLICTLSSGMCRVAYELKLGTEEEDASNRVFSLDIPHHYAWVIPASRIANYNHKAKSSKEISFNKGDVLIHKNEYCTVNAALKGKIANGFTKMVHSKKEITQGFIPIYKT